jgi:hypothetical protein
MGAAFFSYLVGIWPITSCWNIDANISCELNLSYHYIANSATDVLTDIATFGLPTANDKATLHEWYPKALVVEALGAIHKLTTSFVPLTPALSSSRPLLMLSRP